MTGWVCWLGLPVSLSFGIVRWSALHTAKILPAFLVLGPQEGLAGWKGPLCGVDNAIASCKGPYFINGMLINGWVGWLGLPVSLYI